MRVPNNFYHISQSSSLILGEAIGVISILCSGKNYLVGGGVYRRLIHHAWGDLAGKADLDFLTLGDIDFSRLPYALRHFQKIPKGQSSSLKSGNCGAARKIPSEFSMSLMNNLNGTKIDLISIKDIAKQFNGPETLETYFATVPLDIQAIAVDLLTGEIKGNGVNAITSREVRVNNPAALDIYRAPHDINSYGRIKAASLPSFTFIEKQIATCTCSSWDVFHKGCKCGGI